MDTRQVAEFARPGRRTLDPVARVRCRVCPIRRLTFCTGFEDAGLDVLELLHQGVEVEENEALFLEGDPADRVYNLLSGALRIYKLLPDGRRQITGFVLPGDFVGLAVDGEYVYSAEAIAESALCEYDQSDVSELFAFRMIVEPPTIA